MAEGQGRSSGQGVKLLYIRDYLYAHATKEHPKNVKKIKDFLMTKGITASEKTIYNAMNVCVVGLNGGFGEVLCRLGQHEILKNFRHRLGGKSVHSDGFFHRNSGRMPFVKIAKRHAV